MPPRTTSCSRPCTRVIPSGLPERSLVAKFPSVQITFGRISAIWRKRWLFARGDLLGLGVAVPGRAALEHVHDGHVVTGEVDAGEELVEELTGGADERDALLVLVEARGLAHEHHVGVGRARPEHDLRARRRERAACAARDRVAQRGELGCGSLSASMAAAATAPATAAAASRGAAEARLLAGAVSREDRELTLRLRRSRSRGTAGSRRSGRAPRSATRSSYRRTRRSASWTQVTSAPVAHLTPGMVRCASDSTV